VGSSALGIIRSAAAIVFSVFAVYLLAAKWAFAVDTCSGQICAPFWPSSIVLLAALLVVPRDLAWLCIAAAFPAHVIAATAAGQSLSQAFVGFLAGATAAAFSGYLVLRTSGETSWLGTTSKAVRYIVFIGFACPAIGACVGALVPILGGGPPGQYFTYWYQWFAANVVGALTLGPVLLLLAGEDPKRFWPKGRTRQIEAVGLLLAVLITTHAALQGGQHDPTQLLRLPLLFAPLAWMSIRFGMAGASASILAATVVAICHALNGSGPFIHGNPDSNTVALQAFLVALAIPVLLLGAASGQTQVAEEKLDEDEEQIALAAAATNAGFYRHEFASDTIWMSDAGRSLLGLPTSGDVTQKRLLARVYPDDSHVAASALFGGGRQHGESSAEFRIVSPDGSLRWILSRSRAKISRHRNNYDTAGIILDVTSRKLAEAEAEQRRRELTHLMRVSQMGQLSGSLAHELSQPLTAILAKAEVARLLLQADPCDLKAVIEALDNIIQQDQRAGEIIKRMRSLLKNKELGVEPIDINDLCQGLRTLLHVELINRGATLEIIQAPDLPNIFGDSVQLQQVLINLVMNAIEATQRVEAPRRCVAIKIRKLGADSIEIAVQDNGPGIGADEQARLFEPFFTTKERGLGLGLPICSTILRRHGGTLSLENNERGGATAFLRLPIRPTGVRVS
jgi:signal transduction histidine kinase